MHKRALLITARLVLGGAVLFAAIWQAIVIHREGQLDLFNYLGYFTNLSNIVAGCIFVISALYLIKSRKPSRKDDLIRGAAVLYMTVTGLVYVTLLTGEDLGLLLPWVNILMHIVMPVAVLADWLYQPPYTKPVLKQAALWLVFPLVYLVYTLIRGSITGWYPYPFLDPDKVGGYAGVALYGIGVLVAFLGLGWLLYTAGNRLKRHI